MVGVSEFGIEGPQLRFQGSGRRVWGFRAQGSGFGV